MIEFDREVGKEMLLDLKYSLDELQIPFFLLQGTALGAYRDHGFVPTEKDIDLGILIENLSCKVPALLSYLTEMGYEVETRNRTLPFKEPHTIVVYDTSRKAKADLVGLHKNEKKGHRYTCTPDNPVEILEPYCIVHEAALLENYQTIGLFGEEFLIPSPIETYLEREYGEDWRTPKEDHVSRTRVYDYLRKEVGKVT